MNRTKEAAVPRLGGGFCIADMQGDLSTSTGLGFRCLWLHKLDAGLRVPKVLSLSLTWSKQATVSFLLATMPSGNPFTFNSVLVVHSLARFIKRGNPEIKKCHQKLVLQRSSPGGIGSCLRPWVGDTNKHEGSQGLDQHSMIFGTIQHIPMVCSFVCLFAYFPFGCSSSCQLIFTHWCIGIHSVGNSEEKFGDLARETSVGKLKLKKTILLKEEKRN